MISNANKACPAGRASRATMPGCSSSSARKGEIVLLCRVVFADSGSNRDDLRMFQEGKAQPISTPAFLEYFESELAQLSPDESRRLASARPNKSTPRGAP